MTDPLQLHRHLELETTHWWLVETKRLAADAIRRGVPRRARVLDAGAGVAGIAAALAPDYGVVSMDVAGAAVALMRSRGTTAAVQAGVEDLPFHDASFDAVVSIDVLCQDGVRDEARAVREAARVLRAGGLFVLHLPAYQWMHSAHDAAAGQSRRYTVSRARALVHDGGLVLVSATYRNSFLLPLAVLRRKVLRVAGSDMRPTHPLVNRVLRGVLRAERAWLRRGSFPCGLSVLVVARKTGAGSVH